VAVIVWKIEKKRGERNGEIYNIAKTMPTHNKKTVS